MQVLLLPSNESTAQLSSGAGDFRCCWLVSSFLQSILPTIRKHQVKLAAVHAPCPNCTRLGNLTKKGARNLARSLWIQTRHVSGDNLPLAASFQPHVCGTVSVMDIQAVTLNSDYEAVARNGGIVVSHYLNVFIV